MILNFRQLKNHWMIIVVYLVLVVLVIIGSLFSPVFLKPRNIDNLIRQVAALGIVSLGQTFTILTGGIDLSVGSIISLTTCLTTGIVKGSGTLMLPVALMVILLGISIGFINGLIITRTGVHPLIVTLGTMSIIHGGTLLYTKVPVGSVPSWFEFPAWGNIGFIPFPIILFGLLAALGIFITHKTVLGRHIYATGSNEEAAHLSGVNTNRIKIYVYMISGGAAALTGLYLVSRMGMGDPLVGERYMLDSVVPVLIGGTSLAGGRGGVVGTIAGVFIFTVLSNVLNLIGISSFWQMVVKGVIIIVAVAFYWKEKK